jgi:hypothetical protein
MHKNETRAVRLVSVFFTRPELLIHGSFEKLGVRSNPLVSLTRNDKALASEV